MQYESTTSFIVIIKQLIRSEIILGDEIINIAQYIIICSTIVLQCEQLLMIALFCIKSFINFESSKIKSLVDFNLSN